MPLSGRQMLLILLVLLTTIALLLHIRWLFYQRHSPPQSLYRSAKQVSSVVSREKNPILQYRPAVNPPTPLLSQRLDDKTLTLDSLRDLYFQEVIRVHLKCSSLVRVGRQGDGGWDVCMDKGYKPRPKCLVYSFGVGNIWEFDEQMASRYNCTVRAFDPTMGKSEHVHKPGPVYFYPIGLGGVPESNKGSFPTRSLLTFLRQFKERQHTLDVVKIDVEYSEWESLERIIKDGLLGQVKQLMMEYHTNEVNKKHSDLEHYRRYLMVMQKLEAAGFRKFKATRNHGAVSVFQGGLHASERSQAKQRGRSCCYEVYYINTAYRATG